MSTLAKALDLIQSKTGATAEQSAAYLAQAANERVSIKLLEADSNEREKYPISPIPFPDLRGRYKSIRQCNSRGIFDKDGRMPMDDLNAAIHGTNNYQKLFEYAVNQHHKIKALEKRVAELESELES